jgi:putative ABC transport system ATP-binding protein
VFCLKNLTLIYNINKSEKVFAIKNVNLLLPNQGLIGIIGPSGSGKTTLMYCLSTLKEPTSGEIWYEGKMLKDYSRQERENLRRKEFGFVFQRHFLIHYMNALDNVIAASLDTQSETLVRGKTLLFDLGIKQSEIYQRPAHLSSGQRQKVAVARAMINSPKVIFADEPTSSLDHDNAKLVMNVLKEYAKQQLVLVITHDMSIIKDADGRIQMWDGCISDTYNISSGEVIC